MYPPAKQTFGPVDVGRFKLLEQEARDGAQYTYTPALPKIMERVCEVETICRSHDVPPPATATQFAGAHSVVPRFFVEARTIDQREQNLAWFDHPVSAEIWSELKCEGRLRENAPTPQ